MIELLSRRHVGQTRVVGHPDNHTITEHTLNTLDAVELAGYEITHDPVPHNNFLVIFGKAPGRLGIPVVMKLPRSSEAIGHEKVAREVYFLEAAGSVTKQVPRVLDVKTIALDVNGWGDARVATGRSGQAEEYSLLIEEHKAGRDLYERVSSSGPLSPIEIWDGLHRPAKAIDRFGQRLGIVHRDIKASNLVGPTGYVIDFDIAVANSETINTDVNNSAVGTSGYTPAEQLLPDSRLTHAANVFPFAATLLFAHKKVSSNLENTDWAWLVFQQDKFEAAQDQLLTDSDLDMPVPIQDVFRRGMAWNAEDRYDSCTELLVDFMKANSIPRRKLIFRSRK